jgi:hypothetical protein
MGIFCDRCERCNARVKKRARMCSQCGAPSAHGWWKCPACSNWVGSDSKFCWNCRAALHPEDRDWIAGGQWQRPPGVVAQRFEVGDLYVLLKRGLSVSEGTVSTSFDAGRPWSFEMPGCQLGAGRSRVVRFECAPPPGVRGLKVLHWDVSFICAEQEQRFEAQSEHSVYASDLSAEALVGRLSIDIRQGDAGVVRLGDFYSDALKSRSVTLRELVQEMTEAPPVWETLDLWQKEARSMVLPPPPPEARLRALTLHLETRRIHLLAAQPVRLDRGRECDLVARCFDRNGQALEQNSLRISKVHACLERCAEGVRYTDRSANGTLFDGQPLVRGMRLLTGAAEHTAGLGGTSAAATPLTLHIRPLACGFQTRPEECAFGEACGFHDAAGAAVRRSDDVAEAFVAVWCHVRLRQADPDLGGLRVWRRQDAFGFRLGRLSGWLAPGMALELGSGHRLRVTAHSQQHLEEGRQHDSP